MTGFRYFEAPESDMTDLLPGLQRCDLCGSEGRCFDLDNAVIRAGEGVGCVDCLHAGRFGFFHVTEAGYLDENGLKRYDDDQVEEPKRTFVVAPEGGAAPVPRPLEVRQHVTVAPSAVEELLRTPAFPTWNEVSWPLHCNDFMVYLGTWQPRDIRLAAASRGRLPREVFVDMTDPSNDRLLPDDAEEWGLTLHAFRCTACGELRGAIDLD